MDIERLNKLVKTPDLVSYADIDFLNEVIVDYPYFQAARLLLANASKESEEIKTAAVYTAHRSVLKKVINKEFDADINLPNLNNLELDQEEFNAIENLQDTFDYQEETIPPFTVYKNEEETTTGNSEDYPNSFETSTFQTSEESETSSDFSTESETNTDDITSEENTEIPFSDISFEEPNYNYPEPLSEDNFLSNDEDELEIFNTADIDIPQTDISSSYDELMASLEELKKTRQNNPNSFYEEQENEQEEALLEVKHELKEREPLHEKMPETTGFIEEPNTTKGTLAEENEEEQSSTIGFAMDSLLAEYENKAKEKTSKKEKKKNEMLNENTSDVFESNFALDALLQNSSSEKKTDKSTEKNQSVSQHEIINQFISKADKIKIPKDEVRSNETLNQEDLATRSVEQGSLAVSENLAQILVKQGKFEKAIEIYKALVLKYPDKKAYFAAQIEFLKNKK